MPSRTIAVLGSLNVDLVTRLERVPGRGETVAARDFAMYPGGKGANQAVACGKLGADVRLYGMVGDDALADRLFASLDASGVQRTAVRRLPDASTGTASIWVEGDGENRIAIAAGANGRVDASYVDRHLEDLAAAGYLLLQLEVPLPTIVHLLRSLPAQRGPRVILDPAPALPLDALPRGRVWMLTPNEHELAALTGLPTDDPARIARAAAALADTTGAEFVLVKAGARGAYLCRHDTVREVPGFAVRAVDTTAAGDTFNGALATALTQAPDAVPDLDAAVAYAHAAAALSVTRPGAQPAMPAREDVEAFQRRAQARARR